MFNTLAGPCTVVGHRHISIQRAVYESICILNTRNRFHLKKIAPRVVRSLSKQLLSFISTSSPLVLHKYFSVYIRPNAVLVLFSLAMSGLEAMKLVSR